MEGVSEGLGIAEVQQSKELEEEKKRESSPVADFNLEKQLLQDVLSKKL